MVVIILVIGFVIILWEKILPPVLPAVFTIYLVYGFVRPRLSRKIVHEIEDEEDDDETSGYR